MIINKQQGNKLEWERNLSKWRVSAYTCTISPSNIPIKNKGKAYITGWYDKFSENRLNNEIVPKLNEYVENKMADYPILITEHTLEKEATAILSKMGSSKKLNHLEWERRPKATEQRICAVVLSSKEYRIL
jgi:hypothetical protein